MLVPGWRPVSGAKKPDAWLEMSGWWVPRCGFVWKCCVPLNPMVLLIIIPIFYGYFFGNIPYFPSDQLQTSERPASPIVDLSLTFSTGGDQLFHLKNGQIRSRIQHWKRNQLSVGKGLLDTIRTINKWLKVMWQCVKTLYPCSSHQNSW